MLAAGAEGIEQVPVRGPGPPQSLAALGQEALDQHPRRGARRVAVAQLGRVPGDDIRHAQPLGAESFEPLHGQPDQFQSRLVELCASVGVAFTPTPALPKLAISGATRWIGSEKAAISLSLRHKTDDQLWFSFFHEACHVLEHKTSAIYIDAPGDPDGDPIEQRANEFARDMLIPPQDYERFVASGKPGLNRIRAFAEEIDISPGIVVGRLQHEGVVPHSFANSLKTKLRWDFEA